MDYKILKTIGKGGMGEVMLAFDPTCERQVAIKRIRQDLKQHKQLKSRFLREAKITAQLTHPGIISIYSIHHKGDELYYTMPYVEGETLRQMLRRKQDVSIPALLPIFQSICQTIAYAHSRGILHRDLKPENILVGKFGEVIILDWGLAQAISEPSEEPILDIPEELHLTTPGKLVGTIAFMAPERALGAEATIQTDIYALGVILYLILTLRLPFDRTSIKEFQKTYKHEKLIDPEENAPYRDVPPRLSQIVKKCLDSDPSKRYQDMEELMHDLKSHLEGRSEWFESARLQIQRKKHWEFQENVLISKHIAITRTTETAEWVSIMVSKAAFAENTRLQTRVKIGDEGAGIGFLLSIPEAAERENPLEGYCLWLGSEEMPFSQLFRNTIEVMHLNDLHLKQDTWHTITIERVDNNIHFYLNDEHRFTYPSYLPMFGTHIGILSRDADFEMDEIVVYVGSQNLMVSCLSIPDAFMASRDYKRALAEYRRIGYSFPGHAEGREALFRAGITLLEQARTSKDPKQTESFYTLAIEEFAKLHHTPGAPLEYLGKALVYQSLHDHSEEVKCLELGLRRYYKHPLVNAIREQIIYRMHEAAQMDRRTAYQLILIALRLLPDVVKNIDSLRLFKQLITNWEPLPFFDSSIDPSLLGKEKLSEIRFAIPLAFWLASPFILQELFQEVKSEDEIAAGDIIFALIELGSYKFAHQLVEDGRFKPIYLCHEHSLDEAMKCPIHDFRTLCYLMQYAIIHDQEEKVHILAETEFDSPLSREDKVQLDGYRIWAYLKQNDWQSAKVIFNNYSLELLNQETTFLHFLYGCWLLMTENEEIASIHFAGVIDTIFPRSWALIGHELTNNLSQSSTWFSTSFMWERRRLYQQLTLYYHCAGNSELEEYYKKFEREEYIDVTP